MNCKDPKTVAIELKNAAHQLEEWREDKRLYCWLHCGVFENEQVYIDSVEKLLK